MSKSLFYKVHLPQDLELRYVYNLIPWEYVLSVECEKCFLGNMFCQLFL